MYRYICHKYIGVIRIFSVYILQMYIKLVDLNFFMDHTILLKRLGIPLHSSYLIDDEVSSKFKLGTLKRVAF